MAVRATLEARGELSARQDAFAQSDDCRSNHRLVPALSAFAVSLTNCVGLII